MSLTSFSFQNKALIKFIMWILLIGGIGSFYQMSKMEDPEITVTQAVIITTYPGASAYEVELELTKPIEDAIRTMGEIKSVESKSTADLSIIKVNVYETTNSSELQQVWDLLRRKVNDVSATLPSAASKPIVADDYGDVTGMFFAMTVDGYKETDISNYAAMVERELKEIAGVGKVQIYGLRTPSINIEMSQSQISSIGVLPSEIVFAISGHNKPIYGGYYNSGGFRVRADVSDKFRSIEDIQNVIISGHQGEKFKLDDIATIKYGFAEPTRNLMRYDSQRAIGISIAMRHGFDITKVGKELINKIDELQLPAGIELHKVFFQPDRVNEAIYSFSWNLALSIVIVIAVLMFTMGWRSGVIIGIGLLLTVFGTILVLNLLDGTIQRVSLATFILAMGMLVDNSIVVVDGILLDYKKGIKRPKLLTNTADKTAMPLLGATLIAILAFLPIFLSKDTAGQYVRDLFIVLSVSLLLSWALALVQVPIHAASYLKLKGSKKDKGENKSTKMLRRVLKSIIAYKYLTITIAVGLLVISLWSFKFVQQGFFPNMVYNQLYIEYLANEGNSTDNTKEKMIEIENYLKSRGEVTHITTSLGATPARYNLVRTINEPSLSYAELIVDFETPVMLENSIDEIQEYLSRSYPEAYIRVKRYNLMYMSYPIEVMFRGNDPAILKELAEKAESVMESCPRTTLITNNWAAPKPSMMAHFNSVEASRASISRSDVGMSLLAATEGLPIGTFYEGSHSLPIYFKTTNQDGRPYRDLENIPVWRLIPTLAEIDPDYIKDGVVGVKNSSDLISDITSTVPLSLVTDSISLIWEEPIIRRYNSSRAIKAQCNMISGSTAEQVRQMLINDINTIELPDGYTMQWMGEYDASSTALTNLFKNVPLAIVLMILILIALFKDFKKPIIIILCLPLASIGIVAAILLSGKEFGFVAIVGALGLIGMMIKNGVVLIDEITYLINSGVPPFNALVEASTSRFRPVMLASFTTILGMVPLVSDDMFGSMAVTIMGGLFVGTIITLVMIPLFYAIFFNIKVENKN